MVHLQNVSRHSTVKVTCICNCIIACSVAALLLGCCSTLYTLSIISVPIYENRLCPYICKIYTHIHIYVCVHVGACVYMQNLKGRHIIALIKYFLSVQIQLPHRYR
jgi:hypothetical protein